MLAGAIGALLPDLDRLIHSGADPLLHIEFHRHFTHALAFVPVGGVLAALPWLLRRDLRPRWRVLLLAATLGYATHGVLDACTTYGTLLFWPFSHQRVAWNLISIIDPLFTGALLVGLAIGAVFRRQRQAARVVGVACLMYLALGARQRDRAFDAQRQIARARGHVPERAAVFPGFANQVVWRSLYEAGGTLYMDRIRVPWVGEGSWREGARAEPVALAERLAAVVSPRVAGDVARVAWFAQGWVARDPGDPTVIGDARYSLTPDVFAPVWGVRVTEGTDPPVQWVDHSRGRRVDFREWRDEVMGRAASFRRLPSDGAR